MGQRYTSQPPTITIAFADGAVVPVENRKNAKEKIHRVCMIMDKEDGTIFTEALELHYIDMKAFAKAVNDADSINIQETNEDMFAYWLSVIAEKDIVNKDIIENARKDKEVIRMAVSAIARQSEDKIMRQAYQRRKDEIFFHNIEPAQATRRAETAERASEEKDALIAQLKAQLGEK